MSSFAQRRAQRIADLQASAAYDANAPLPVVVAPSLMPRTAYAKHAPKPEPAPPVPSRSTALEVDRYVLRYCLAALQSGNRHYQQVAARMLSELDP